MPTEHTSKKFDAELEAVRSRVLQMGGLVEQQIVRAMEVLVHGDLSLADKVIADDHRVNALEVGIDDDCTHIIAKRQPTASDLRMLMAVVKTITDLERIGDEAKKIARMAKQLHQSGTRLSTQLADVRYACNIALDMLNSSLDAFARLDVSGAAKVVQQDEEVDERFRAILRQLMTFMMEDPRTISASIDILFIAKAIERIGDHAKNMSEYVVYLVKGKDVRHITTEELVKVATEVDRFQGGSAD
ncbi:MAG: phosphate signaling complex protein PhoU [Betaproteobacteria bacterium]|jgi:phosphate transport system protein|nr:transcriptional regulator PhoU [Betaproteobacteria bacterium UKL13-2]HCG52420.1 phosphate transport system regulatory protein PhoU [Betaproteobacteria bacterium]